METAVRTFNETNPEDLKGSLIICPVINTPGFQHGTLYVNPLDGKNMNRVYPGDKYGTISDKMIYVVLNELIRQCEWHIDLHGGEPTEDHGQYVIYAKGLGTKEVDEKTHEMARHYLPNLIQATEGPSKGNSSSEVCQLGIPSITPEAGALGAYRDADIQFHMKGVKNVMKWLGMLPEEGPPEEPMKDIPIVPGSNPLQVQHGGIFYPKFKAGDLFKKGELMAQVKDMFGKIVEEIHAPADGRVAIMFPKRVKIAGETVFLYFKL